MPDREKVEHVINAFERVIEVFDGRISGPYFEAWMCATKDALALLKAQEAETMDAPKPDSDIGCWYDITHNYTLEQVVSALKEQEPPTSEFISSAIECLLHPQDADDSDMAKAIDTAVRAMRLLKAQEAQQARVMDVDEVREWVGKQRVNREPICVEVKDNICAWIVSDEYWDMPMDINLSSDLYGKTWRCWTSRPTEAEREATPWKT